MNYFDLLPDNQLLEFCETLDTKELSRLSRTSWRLLNVCDPEIQIRKKIEKIKEGKEWIINIISDVESIIMVNNDISGTFVTQDESLGQYIDVPWILPEANIDDEYWIESVVAGKTILYRTRISEYLNNYQLRHLLKRVQSYE